MFMVLLMIVNLRKKSDSNISVLMRVLTNYFQILATALSFNLQFPDYMVDAFSSVRKVGGSSEVFLSFDCLLINTRATEIFDNIAFLKVLCLAMMPIALIIPATIAYRFIFLKNKDNFIRYTCVTMITTMFLLHPSLTSFCLRIFKCTEIGDGRRQVEMDITTDCWSLVHLKWIFALAIPMLIFYVIGFPVFVIIVLYRNRKNLFKEDVRKYYLLLSQGVKYERYYWEIVNMSRKIILLFIHVFIVSDLKILKALLGAVLLFF